MAQELHITHKNKYTNYGNYEEHSDSVDTSAPLDRNVMIYC